MKPKNVKFIINSHDRFVHICILDTFLANTIGNRLSDNRKCQQKKTWSIRAFLKFCQWFLKRLNDTHHLPLKEPKQNFM